MIVQTTTTLSESLLRVIEQEMAERHISVSELARTSGVSRVALSRTLSRHNDLRLESLDRVLAALGVELMVIRTETPRTAEKKVTVADAAQILGVSRQRVHQKIAAKRIPADKSNPHKTLIRRRDIDSQK